MYYSLNGNGLAVFIKLYCLLPFYQYNKFIIV